MENISIFMKLDEKDIKILEIIKENAKLTSSQISKKTRIPITTIHNRIKKLEKQGIIKNYTVSLDFEKIGKPLAAYILLTVNQNISQNKKISQKDIGKKIKMFEDVESVDVVTGAIDILIKARVKTMHDLNNLLTNRLRKIDGVDKTQTMMVLEEI